MKRYLVLFLITVFMVAPGRWMTTSAQAGVIASQVVDKAVPDNVVDEKSIAQRAMQFGQTIKNSIEQLANLESQLNTAKEMANGFQAVYSVYDALFTGDGIITSLYNETNSLLSDVETISRRATNLASSGQLPLSKARDIVDLCDYAVRSGLSIYDYALDNILNKDKKLDIKTRLEFLNNLLEQIKSLRKTVNDDFEEEVKMVKDSIAVVTLENLMDSAYDDVPFVMANGKKFKIPTTDEYLKMMNANEKNVKDDPLAKEDADIKSVGENHNLRNFLLCLIGIIALIMTLPAYLKYNSGERQSLNTIWKLVAGTVVMIGIVFLFDEIFF